MHPRLPPCVRTYVGVGLPLAQHASGVRPRDAESPSGEGLASNFDARRNKCRPSPIARAALREGVDCLVPSYENRGGFQTGDSGSPVQQ